MIENPESTVTYADARSIFEKESVKSYKHRYNATIIVSELHGGWPVNQQVALDHLRRKLADNDELLRAAVAEQLAEQTANGETPDVDAAAVEVALAKNLNGFKKDSHGLYVEGRHVKALLKEAASVAVNAGRVELKGWGLTNKWLTKWLPEHCFVLEDRIYLGRDIPDGIAQRFVVSRHGTGIQLEEYALDVKLDFTVVTDFEIKPADWAAIWTTAEFQGLGASRSQGYGTFKMLGWEATK